MRAYLLDLISGAIDKSTQVDISELCGPVANSAALAGQSAICNTRASVASPSYPRPAGCTPSPVIPLIRMHVTEVEGAYELLINGHRSLANGLPEILSEISREFAIAVLDK